MLLFPSARGAAVPRHLRLALVEAGPWAEVEAPHFFCYKAAVEDVTLVHATKGPLARLFLESRHGGRDWCGHRGEAIGSL